MNKTINTENYLKRANIIAQKEILSFKEALVYLDVSSSFLYKLTSKKEIPFTKPNGGKIYFKKIDLDNWILKGTSESSELLSKKIDNYLKRGNNGKTNN